MVKGECMSPPLVWSDFDMKGGDIHYDRAKRISKIWRPYRSKDSLCPESHFRKKTMLHEFSLEHQKSKPEMKLTGLKHHGRSTRKSEGHALRC